MKSQHGLALPVVLWVAILLTVIAGALTGSLRIDTAQTSNQLRQAEALALAEGGVWAAVSELLRPAADRRWPVDGTPRVLEVAGHRVQVRIEDEGGRIDLNTAHRELLANLFTHAGLSQADAAALVDSLMAARGAAPFDGAPRPARQGPFNAVENLLAFPGVTPALYRRVAPALTVHSQQTGIRPDAAPLEALLAVPGVTAAEAGRINASRGRQGLSDPGGFSSLARPFLVLGGQPMNYRVTSEARIDGVGARITAVVHTRADGDRPYAFLEWRQGHDPGDPG